MMQQLSNAMAAPVAPEAFIAAIAALSCVITYLWKQISNTTGKLEKKLEHCEESHKETDKKFVELTGRVGYLEGHQAGVTELANQVLKAVSPRKNDSPP